MGLCRSGGASSTSMTSKPSKGRPGACWRKRGRPSRKHHLRASQGSQGRVCAPESIQIGASPLPGRDCLHTLILKEPHDIFPLPPSCFPRPQIYVEQHPAPAGDLPFQLGLQGVFLAQKETIDFLLPCLRAWGTSEQVVDLASGPLHRAVPLCFLLSHEKRLLAHCTRYPPFCGAEPKRRRRLEEASTRTYDANGYQATSSDRCFL